MIRSQDDRALIMDKRLESISDQTINRYSERYKKHGYNVITLGWGTTEQQEHRFSQTLSDEIDFNGRDILDIGCGFGDYYSYSKTNNVPLKNYIGWDINQDLISEATKQHQMDKSASFRCQNLIGIGDNEDPVADIGVMLGVLNLNFYSDFDNYEYSRMFISKAFSLVRDVLVVDFLSTHLCDSWPKEDFVFYHDPVIMLQYAFSLSKNVVFKHNYAPIPQKEFMMFIYR